MAAIVPSKSSAMERNKMQGVEEEWLNTVCAHVHSINLLLLTN